MYYFIAKEDIPNDDRSAWIACMNADGYGRMSMYSSFPFIYLRVEGNLYRYASIDVVHGHWLPLTLPFAQMIVATGTPMPRP